MTKDKRLTDDWFIVRDPNDEFTPAYRLDALHRIIDRRIRQQVEGGSRGETHQRPKPSTRTDRTDVEVGARAAFECRPAFASTAEGAPRWTWDTIDEHARIY